MTCDKDNLMNTHGKSAPQLWNRWLWLARTAWLVITLLLLVVFSLSLRLAYTKMVVLPTGSIIGSDLPVDALRTGLAQLGLSTRFYAGYLSALLILFVLVYTGVGAVIFWRKAGDPLALLISLWLVIFGITFPPPINDLMNQTTQANWLTTLLFWFLTAIQFVGFVVFFLLFYLFPDGRFVPRWTRWFAALCAGMLLINEFLPGSPLALNTWHPLLSLLFLLSLGISMMYAQFYRYRYVSGSVQREQTKWVVFGLVTALAGFIMIAAADLFPSLKQPGALALLSDLTFGTILILTFLCVPLAIGIAILRYHLYAIDILIRRTLIYSLLTALLGLIYFSSVILLQPLSRTITGEGQNQLVTVVSTLAIVALFTPLRRRVQNAIDWRFYRRKVDVEQILAAFGLTIRDETNLDKLAKAVVGVVEETMQPAHLSLWLRKPGLFSARGEAPSPKEAK